MAETAAEFVAELQPHGSAVEREKIRRYFRGSGDILGVRMKTTFDLAKASVDMPLPEVERLLDVDLYEAKVGAVSILDAKARRKGVTDDDRREWFDLYLRRHDRIDSWDLVDRAAPRVIGGYLLDKPRDVLHRLARSTDVWERRTAITASFWLIRDGQVDDALAISELLLGDDEELIHKSVGTALREVGIVEPARQLAFLERHAPTMPRVTLRYAVERLDAPTKARLLKPGAAGGR